MGKGKGALKLWVCLVSKGDIILEIKGSRWRQAKEVLLQIKQRLSIKAYIRLDKNLFY
jgi:ribosomal protein L16/L10AE